MKNILILFPGLFFVTACYAQNSEQYHKYIQQAEEQSAKQDYINAAQSYSKAFAANNGTGSVNDRYNAACIWSLAGNKDSAFYQLNRIAAKGNYADHNHLVIDPDLVSLHDDARWADLDKQVIANKQKEEQGLIHKDAAAVLDTVFIEDQRDRMLVEAYEKKYGRNSPEVASLFKKITKSDSINIIRVTAVLDKYGWAGPDDIGRSGNTTLFLVIQHADIKVQQHYLPMMRQAVKDKKARASSLALLEDRVALRTGKKQIYGSQINSFENGTYYISPLEDPDNVDKRRAAVGLQPLAEYVAHWQIKWDVQEYKKQLPAIEAEQKKYSE